MGNPSSVRGNVTFNTHKLFVGDICYALKEDIYDKFWGDTKHFRDGIYPEQGFVVGSTAYGDGCYRGSDGTEFGVDAGVIGVTDIENFGEDKYSEDTLKRLGKIIEVPSGTTRVDFYDEDGGFDIAISSEGKLLYHVIIETEEDDWDEEEEDYDDFDPWAEDEEED